MKTQSLVLIVSGLLMFGCHSVGAVKKVDNWYDQSKLEQASTVLSEVRGYFLLPLNNRCIPSERFKNLSVEIDFAKNMTADQLVKFKYFEGANHLEMILKDPLTSKLFGLEVELEGGLCQKFELAEFVY